LSHEEPEEAKMLRCFLDGLGDDRHVQTLADCLSDLPERHTLFGDRVIPGSRTGLLQREPVEADFVTFDNFMDPGDGSMDGWSWSMRGRVTNTETITQQENYARVNRGLSYEGEGQNRNIPANLNTTSARDFFFDPTGAATPYSNATASLKGGTDNILAGDGDHAATDGPTRYQQGWS
jgi:hypothetical protein